jgi:acyl-ACP thioesterase
VVAADGDNPDNAKVFGYGRSIWAMIDTETRQPTNIFDIDDGAIMKWVEKDKVNPMTKLTRVQMDDNARLVRSIDTFYNDVDINGHINSVKYIEHVLDLFPLDWYKEHPLKRFDIAYVAEAHQGDKLDCYREQTALNEYCIRLVKTGPNDDKPVEVCRCKAVFADQT